MAPSADKHLTGIQHALAGVYSIERELGRGGMGIVYLAREVELDRYVALKILPRERANDADTRARFLREARVAASLSHPNIVQIHRVGEIADVVFFSMAFVDGGTLGDRLRARGPLAPSAATQLLRDVAQALAYSHGRGIIHRDVKPDNILLDRVSGRAMVTDFGIAAATGEDAAASRVAGTLHFMSPEQAAGSMVDERSDIYSLGVVGFLSLSGTLPQPGASLGAVAPSTPRNLTGAIDRAIRVDPAERFRNAEALANAFESRVAARAELPVAVREWMAVRDPWALPYVVWSVLWLFIAYNSASLSRPPIASTWIALAMIPLTLIPAGVFQLLKARKLFDMGYVVDDMRAAFDLWHAERAAEIEVHSKPLTRLIHGTARVLALTPVAAFLAIMLNRSPMSPFVPGTFLPLLPFVGGAMVLSIPLLNAFGIPMLPSSIRQHDKLVGEWFWQSRFGRLAERFLMKGRTRAIPPTAFRPTESVLASAIVDLFDALPVAFREHLAGLPDVTSRLEAHAREARATLAHLEGVTAVDRDEQLESARARARQELAESVGAIESLRLDLLRLLGGDADLRPTTTILDAARRVDSDIQRLHRAHTEPERTPCSLGLDLRPHTPA